MTETIEELQAKLEKAEAELARSEKATRTLAAEVKRMSEANEANAVKLARYCPLIESARMAYEHRQGGYGLDMSEVQEAVILCGYNAALKAKEFK